MTTDAAGCDDGAGFPRGIRGSRLRLRGGAGAFAALARQRGVRLPEEVPPWGRRTALRGDVQGVEALGAATYTRRRGP